MHIDPGILALAIPYSYRLSPSDFSHYSSISPSVAASRP